MTNWFRKPYPFLYEEPLNRLKAALFVTFFVFLFLYVFEPFNIQEVHRYSVLSCALIYALTSGVVCYLSVHLLVRLYPGFASDQSWNVGREMIMMLAILLLISVVNFTVGVAFQLYPDEDKSISEIALLAISRTFSVGFFPVMIITFVNYTVMLKRNLAGAQKHHFSHNDKEPELIIKVPVVVNITSPANNNDIEVDLDNLIYIMADGNYVEFHLLDQGNRIREIRRNTMSNVSQQLKDYSFIFRTHRAYMVNLEKIEESKGNAQGYQLKLECCDNWVPVSRGNLAAFDEMLNANNVLVEQYSV